VLRGGRLLGFEGSDARYQLSVNRFEMDEVLDQLDRDCPVIRQSRDSFVRTESLPLLRLMRARVVLQAV
jgi:hypothetical protein